MIGRGHHLPNGRLPSERDLASMLGVSRPIVREALSVLSHEGVIEVRLGAGTFVKRRPERLRPALTDDDIRRVLSGHNIYDLFELRKPLEQETAYLAAQRATPANLEALTRAHLRMRHRTEAGQPTAEADYAFHYAIAQATQNAIFVTVMDALSSVYAHALERIKASSSQVARASVLREHEAILRAIASRNPQGARAAMLRHLSNMQRNLLAGHLSAPDGQRRSPDRHPRQARRRPPVSR
jgi:GntR family transcriptional regulator, transcriptional repressor for pyruvate dehydrogenase complex